jgi:hypothetical protein
MCMYVLHKRVLRLNMIGLQMKPLKRVGVAPIVEKMVESKLRLRWFGHVERTHVDFVVKRVDQINDSQVRLGL